LTELRLGFGGTQEVGTHRWLPTFMP